MEVIIVIIKHLLIGAGIGVGTYFLIWGFSYIASLGWKAGQGNKVIKVIIKSKLK